MIYTIPPAAPGGGGVAGGERILDLATRNWGFVSNRQPGCDGREQGFDSWQLRFDSWEIGLGARTGT
jgi:hypothetical protein